MTAASSADILTWAVDCLEAALADAASADRGATAARAVVDELGADELRRLVGCLASLGANLVPARLTRGRTVANVLQMYRIASMWAD